MSTAIHIFNFGIKFQIEVNFIRQSFEDCLDTLKALSHIKFEGIILFDRNDGLLRNEIASHIYYDRRHDIWRGLTTGFTAYANPETEKKQLLAIESKRDPRFGFSIMTAVPFGMVGDIEDSHILFDSDAGELLRYRKYIGGEHIAIFTDIKKKHSSHSITNDIDINEFAQTAEFFLSDGVIITGQSTGSPAKKDDLSNLKNINIPIIIGSGLTDENISDYWNMANGFIVGSYFKEKGYWRNSLSKERILKLIEKTEGLKERK